VPRIMKNESKTLSTVGAVALIVTTVWPVAAQADDVASEKKSTLILEEVIVTARKREENLQEVPIAITAIGAEELRQKAIDSPSSLQLHTPSLEVRTSALQRNNLQFFIRGQGATFGSSPSVVTYFSDAAVGNSPKVSIGNNGQFFDLASVQV
jgi:iron complex outermembrane recepter protein